MRMIVLKEIGVIKPPFKATVKEIVSWVKPVTVSVKDDSGVVVGGLLVDKRLLVCTHLVEDDFVKVQFPDTDKVVNAMRVDHHNDMYLSYYAIDEEDARVDWVGLPNRLEEADKDTYLFSYVHDHSKDYVVRLQAVPIANSKAYYEFENGDGRLRIDGASRHSTYPVVDMCGCLFGIGIGESFGEVMCQTLRLKGAKI